jgi:hypothetical protein
MDDNIRSYLPDQIKHSLPVPYVKLMMNEMSQLNHEPVLIPASIPCLPEKNGTLVVIDSMYRITEDLVEMPAYF